MTTLVLDFDPTAVAVTIADDKLIREQKTHKPLLPAGGDSILGVEDEIEAGDEQVKAQPHRDIEAQDPIAQQFDELWKKHAEDVDSGASDEVLGENRHQLEELSRECRKLVEEARQVAPDDLPAWAQ